MRVIFRLIWRLIQRVLCATIGHTTSYPPGVVAFTLTLSRIASNPAGLSHDAG